MVFVPFMGEDKKVKIIVNSTVDRYDMEPIKILPRDVPYINFLKSFQVLYF